MSASSAEHLIEQQNSDQVSRENKSVWKKETFMKTEPYKALTLIIDEQLRLLPSITESEAFFFFSFQFFKNFSCYLSSASVL